MPIHSLTLETSTTCNASCIICPNGYNRRPPHLMSLSEIDCVFGYIKPKEVNLCGLYEPLLDSRFDEILRLIKWRLPEAKIVVYTNGSELHRWVDPIIEYVDEIVFSVHGFSKEIYESIMVGLDRDKVYNNILSFLDRRGSHPKARVSLVRVKQNVGELPVWREFWTRVADDVSDFEVMNWQGNVPVDNLYPSAPPYKTRKCPMFDPEPRTLVVDALGNVALCCYCFNTAMSFGHLFRDGFKNWIYKQPISDTYPTWKCRDCNGWKHA